MNARGPLYHDATGRQTIAVVHGFFSCILLVNLSVARGDVHRFDPPPKPPQWLAEENLGEIPEPNSHSDRAALVMEQDARLGSVQLRLTARPAAYQSPASIESNAPEPLAKSFPDPQPTHTGPHSYSPHYDEPAPMEDLWEFPRVFRPDQYERHRGEGDPLVGASWLNRPYYAGLLIGAWYGDTLIPGEIDQGIGFLYGMRFGWDYDTYWGLEMRLAFSEVGLEFIHEPSVDGLASDVLLWDLNLVYYPWGDARWRPYFGLGFGLVDFDFLTATGIRRSEAVVGIPLVAGLKYRQSDWITLRFDLADNIAFGGRAGFETMNNLSLAGGVEFRFGGTRKSYFPWNPSRTLR